MTGALVLLALLIGAGCYGFWQYNQSQYYVGVSPAGFVSVFRGTNQSLVGINLSSLQAQSTVKVSMLASSDQAVLRQTVSANSLNDAEQRINSLQTEAVSCQQAYQRLAAWQTQYRAYQLYLAYKAHAAVTHAKAPAPVNNPGAMPARMPNAGQCAPSTAFGIPASALPASG